jgi:hypothetical protein
MLPYRARLGLVMLSEEHAVDAVRQCRRIGFDRIEGFLIDRRALCVDQLPLCAGILLPLWTSYSPLVTTGEAPSSTSCTKQSGTRGYIPGAILIHFADLPSRLSDLPLDTSIFVYSRSGYRAAIAASVLEANAAQPILVSEGYPVGAARRYREPAERTSVR